MPLDRAWYNTLVNDDGSGLTGSVWDKEDVDALMDAIDAQIDQPVIAGFPWVDYTPQLNSPQGVIFTTGAALARYQQMGQFGKTVMVQYSIEGCTFSFACTELWIALPFPAAGWAGTQMTNNPIFVNGSYEAGWTSIASNDQWYVHVGRNALQNIPAASGIYFRGSFIYRAQ